jgi:molybdenum cofactor cytidylyltransferase
MRLYRALRIEDGEVVAFTGSGGKTTAMFRLADDLAEHGKVVLSVTRVTVSAGVVQRAPRHFSAFEATRGRVEAALDRHKHLFITGPVDFTVDTAAPVTPGLVDDLLQVKDLGALLIKADDANRRGLKAPLSEEPVVPAMASLVVVMASLETLGEEIIDLNVQHAERVADLAGVALRDDVTPAVMARVLAHPEGGLHGLPDAARVTVFLNHLDLGQRLADARLIARQLLETTRIASVLIGTARKPNAIAEVHGRMAGIVLAAGQSTRMGEPKQLLPWGEGETVLGSVLNKLRVSGLDEIVVVTGAEHEAIEALVAATNDPRLHCVVNPDYASTEMARSLRVGLGALRSAPEAALVALADQPLVPASLIGRVLDRWRETLAPVIAPYYGEQRGHPLLLDRAAWPRFLALPADANPRQALEGLEIEKIAADDNTILLDIDTREDYERARDLAR